MYIVQTTNLVLFANYLDLTNDKLIYFPHRCKLNSCNQMIKIVRNICAKIADLKRLTQLLCKQVQRMNSEKKKLLNTIRKLSKKEFSSAKQVKGRF